MKLNLGCGRNPIEGWTNLDRAALPGVDVVHDLTDPLPFDDDTVTEIIGIDLIEHIADPLALMGELWRVAQQGALCTFALPYGTSDDAWEDPTHVRPYFVGSWMYFAQPTYHRADYSYRGDWLTESVTLHLAAGVPIGPETMSQVMLLRNVVTRQLVGLRAVKPARPPDQSLMVSPTVTFKEG